MKLEFGIKPTFRYGFSKNENQIRKGEQKEEVVRTAVPVDPTKK